MAQTIRTYGKGKFFGVYLLASLKENVRKRFYIGFTVNPGQRLKQHNGGIDKGGAKKTNNRGPWVMILVVHGFPNEITALKFEWAWQNPFISRHLKNVLSNKSGKKETLDFNLNILELMLDIAPWKRLCLSIKWFLNDSLPQQLLDVVETYQHTLSPYRGEYNMISPPPLSNVLCIICLSGRPREKWRCLNETCGVTFHVLCLQNSFISSSDEIIPMRGLCPRCDRELIWNDLVSLFGA